MIGKSPIDAFHRPNLGKNEGGENRQSSRILRCELVLQRISLIYLIFLPKM
jgi:hypothetical protein